VAAHPVCATCDLAIPWAPTRDAGQAYCCGGCAAGGPCTCSYDLPADDEAPAGGPVRAGGPLTRLERSRDRPSPGGRCRR
jgi:hypothetical protein